MSDDLARRQAELVRALVDGGEPPPGFDEAALAAAAKVLRHKRADQRNGDTPKPGRRRWGRK
ncbi:hypothetical protein ACWDTI_19895 [Gordonia sp. NPDC003424]